MSVSRVGLIFFFIVLSVVSFLAWMFWYNEPLFWNALPEFIASFLSGILGIILGFEIDRRFEWNQQQKRIDFTLRSLRDELELNYGRVETLRNRIDKGGECFMLFDTTTWNRFGSQLDSFKDFQFVLSIGYLYWEFEHLNEAMKKGSSATELKNFYTYHPPYHGVNDLLDSLGKTIISAMDDIDKYFFEK